MMEVTVGNSKQDSNRLQLSVTNAIDDIQQVSNLKITNKQEPNFLQNYQNYKAFQHLLFSRLTNKMMKNQQQEPDMLHIAIN